VTLIIVGVADDIGGLLTEHEFIRRCIEQIPMPRMSNDEMKFPPTNGGLPNESTRRIPRNLLADTTLSGSLEF
jgi:hypothetical protein